MFKNVFFYTNNFKNLKKHPFFNFKLKGLEDKILEKIFYK